MTKAFAIEARGTGLAGQNPHNATIVAHIWNPSVPIARRQEDREVPEAHGPSSLALQEENNQGKGKD